MSAPDFQVDASQWPGQAQILSSAEASLLTLLLAYGNAYSIAEARLRCLPVDPSALTEGRCSSERRMRQPQWGTSHAGCRLFARTAGVQAPAVQQCCRGGRPTFRARLVGGVGSRAS